MYDSVHSGIARSYNLLCLKLLPIYLVLGSVSLDLTTFCRKGIYGFETPCSVQLLWLIYRVQLTFCALESMLVVVGVHSYIFRVLCILAIVRCQYKFYVVICCHCIYNCCYPVEFKIEKYFFVQSVCACHSSIAFSCTFESAVKTGIELKIKSIFLVIKQSGS